MSEIPEKPSSFPWVGRLLGDGSIEVLEGIGRGGQGAVYKVKIEPAKYLLSCILTGQSDPTELDLRIFDGSSYTDEQIAQARKTLEERLASITKTGQYKMVRNLSSEDVSPYRRPAGGSKNIDTIYCAMKIIHTKNKLGYIDEDKVNRFFREIEIMKQLENIHIPDSLGDFQEDDYIYHLTEYVDAKIKFDEAETPISQKLIVHVAEGVTDALVYAHKKIIHRDIKPANILMDQEDMIKVLDFGTAKFHEDIDVSHQGDLLLTATNTVLGTVHFFSPEQARGEKVGKPSDIYSLGATLYYLASGEYPRNETGCIRNNPQSIMHNILNRKPGPLPPGLDPLLVKIILRMIAVGPGKRPDAAQAHRMIYNFHAKVPLESWDPDLLEVLDKKNIDKDITPTEQIDLITNEYVSTRQVRNWIKIGALIAAVAVIGVLLLLGYVRAERGKEADAHITRLIAVLESNTAEDINAKTDPLFKELERVQERLSGSRGKRARTVYDQMKTIDSIDRNLDLLDSALEASDFSAGEAILEKVHSELISEKGKMDDERLRPLFNTLNTRFENTRTGFREERTISLVDALLSEAERQAREGEYADANKNLRKASDLFAEYSKKSEYKSHQSRIGRLTALLLSKATAINDYKTAENILDVQFNLLYDPLLVAVKEGRGLNEGDVDKLRKQLRLAADKLDDAGDIVTGEKRKETKIKLENHYARISHLYALNYDITSLRPVEKKYAALKAGLDAGVPGTAKDLESLREAWDNALSDLKRIRKSAPADEYELLKDRVDALVVILDLPKKNSQAAAAHFKGSIEKGDIEKASLYFELIQRAERGEIQDYINAYGIELKLSQKDRPDLHKKAEQIYRKLKLKERAEYHKERCPPEP
ncbi:serine/threonine protein kinase [Planctomycetota bacterium]